MIVGIGASAGGLEAFKSFFGALPEDSGMAFVLVQHLSPDHKSMLSELLGRVSAIGVIEARDGVRVTANTVYVIPPDSTLTIAQGRLNVTRPAPPRDHRRPIDTFLRSLAEDQGENAIAIILAGTGSDGSLGLTAIKDHGGFTLAQGGMDSQAMVGMPRSASATGQVDEVLPVEAMPARLKAYQDHLIRLVDRKVLVEPPPGGGAQISTIITALRARSGHDFSEYKEKTFGRRLKRRMHVLQLDTLEAYIEHFRQSPEELDRLFQELLIGVTEFFRDPAAFESLAANVIKDLVVGRGADEDIRVWVPACSTGQEAYTLAILLREAMDGRRARPKVQIFGTDIDDRAITIARLGRYGAPITGLSQERAERWFTQEGGDVCVVSEIRDMCIFSTHSLIKNPPFSKLDLISCRNLLIYLDPDMQDRVMRTFHYALKPGGRLFLGSSESVTRATDLFSIVDKKSRIFARRDVGRPSLPDLSTGGRGLETLPAPEAAPRRVEDRIDKSTRRVTEKYNPPHVVIDSRDRILRFSGPAMGQFVEIAPGAPSYALFDILRKTLRPAVRAVLKEARAIRGPVRHANLSARLAGDTRFVTLIAEPLEDVGAEPGLFVLVFQDVGVVAPGGREPQVDEESNDNFKALEQELRTTRAQLQSTIDELETANEELKSSNEEYQSVNEELQSSNEEMETSKEEMQSINEEIQTINSEMIGKNEQLTHLNSDLKNLLESTEIATLFLDGQLRIRSFTPSVTEIFHVRENDIGRPISEVVSLLDYVDLQIDARTVLRKLTLVERQVVLRNTKTTFTLRIRPYRTIDNVIDGVVMTFVDMTERQAAQETLRASEARFRMLFEFIDEGFCILEKVDTPPDAPIDFRYLAANAGFEKQSGVANVIGKTIREAFPGESEDWFQAYDAVMVTGEPNRFERDLTTRGRTLEVFAFRFEDDGVHRLGVLFLDVSHRKHHEEQQDLLLREMDHRVKNLFAIVSGMVSLSARSATTPQGLANAVQGRLGALASAHQLIRPGRLGPETLKRETTLDELIRKVLSPYADTAASHDSLHAEITGPDIRVGAEAATSIALIVHELATNAAKYGALSRPDGVVRISWVARENRLALTWAEVGGPALKGPPEREGFGSLLARKSISGQLAGELTFHWNPDGLVVHVEADLERLAL
jgi:two-component system CheB/CheR fusion protein